MRTVPNPPPDGNAHEAVQRRLRAASSRVGGEISLTLYPISGRYSAMLWKRPGIYGPELCREIGHGTLDEVMAAVDALPGRTEAA